VRVAFERAAEVFGPQKGASPDAVRRLTMRLIELAERFPRDPRGMPMSGAGGGLAGALWAVHGAELRGGASFVLETLDFRRRLEGAGAVVVGEGCLDGQTRQGKIAGEILRLAGSIPVHAIVGSLDREAVDREWGELASVRVAGSIADLETAGAALPASLRAAV
jgi:glycerate kinase